MPIRITERSVPKFISGDTTFNVRVDAVKVIDINIDVERRRILMRLQFGRMEGESFVPVGVSAPVIAHGEEFDELSALVVEQADVGKSMYDLIGEKVYTWLVRKGKV